MSEAHAHHEAPAANAIVPAQMTRAAPNRAMSLVAMPNATIGTISGPGAIARPELSADHPHTLCIQRTMDRSIAPNATANSAVAIEAPAKERMRNKAGSTMGLCDREQWTTKPQSSAAAAASTTNIEDDVHPQSFPFTSANVSAATPAMIRTAPKGSGRCTSWPGMSGSLSQPITRAINPIGTLTRKIHRQLTATNNPPITGPRAAATPPTAVHARTAPLRRSGGYDARIRPSDVGVRSAAPAAWTIRAAIRRGTLSTTAQTADATVKIAMPRRNP